MLLPLFVPFMLIPVKMGTDCLYLSSLRAGTEAKVSSAGAGANMVSIPCCNASFQFLGQFLYDVNSYILFQKTERERDSFV